MEKARCQLCLSAERATSLQMEVSSYYSIMLPTQSRKTLGDAHRVNANEEKKDRRER